LSFFILISFVSVIANAQVSKLLGYYSSTPEIWKRPTQVSSSSDVTDLGVRISAGYAALRTKPDMLIAPFDLSCPAPAESQCESSNARASGLATLAKDPGSRELTVGQSHRCQAAA
jgi:hypothetical protein